MSPIPALVEEHGMKRISKRLTSTGTLEVIATAVPGIKDILVLGKVRQLEEKMRGKDPAVPDFIIIDAPEAGHAVTFLASHHGLRDEVNVGPIGNQSKGVIEFLADPARCQVLLVTLPEETPVNEIVETAFHLEDRAGVQLAPIVVNGLYPELDLPTDVAAAAEGTDLDPATVEALTGAADFRRRRPELQAEQVRRLADSLPLPQIPLPLQFTTEIGGAEVDALATAMVAGVEAVDPLPVP